MGGYHACLSRATALAREGRLRDNRGRGASIVPATYVSTGEPTVIVVITPPYYELLPDARSRAYQAMGPHIRNVASEFRLIRDHRTLVIVQHCTTCVTGARYKEVMSQPDVVLASPLMGYYNDPKIVMMACQPPHQTAEDTWADAAPDFVHFVVHWRSTLRRALA